MFKPNVYVLKKQIELFTNKATRGLAGSSVIQNEFVNNRGVGQLPEVFWFLHLSV